MRMLTKGVRRGRWVIGQGVAGEEVPCCWWAGIPFFEAILWLVWRIDGGNGKGKDNSNSNGNGNGNGKYRDSSLRSE